MIFPAFLRRLFLLEFALSWSQRDFGSGITFDFFNTIGPLRTCRSSGPMSGVGRGPDVTGRRVKVSV